MDVSIKMTSVTAAIDSLLTATDGKRRECDASGFSRIHEKRKSLQYVDV